MAEVKSYETIGQIILEIKMLLPHPTAVRVIENLKQNQREGRDIAEPRKGKTLS